MEKRPLLSIVVPTKNRYKYLFTLITLIDSFKSDEIEMVIQDNSDDNSEFFNEINLQDYPFLSYFYETRLLSQTENSELSIKNSKGEFICFIGDDDGVTSGIIEQVRVLKKQGLDAMITRQAVYNWPDYKDDSIFHLSATLSLAKPLGKDTILDAGKELQKVTKKGFANLGLLPKVYQGVVSRSALNKVFGKCGSFFPGPSPDMANAVALTGVIDKYLYFDAPTIITGQSRFVGGGERLSEKLRHLTEIEQLPKDIMDYWDKNLPTLWCTDTIWPGSASIAASRMGIHLEINYDKIYGRFLLNHPSYSCALQNIKTRNIFVLYYKEVFFFRKFINWSINRLSYYLSNKRTINRTVIYRDLMSVIQVAELLDTVK